MHVTPPEAGVIGLVLFSVFYWLGIFATFTAFAGLVSVVLLGTTGWVGRVLTDIAGWIQHLTGTLTSTVIGATFSGLLFIVFAVVFLHDMHPKHATGKRTAWIGVALGALIVAGVTGIPALAGLHSGIVNAASSVLSL